MWLELIIPAKDQVISRALQNTAAFALSPPHCQRLQGNGRKGFASEGSRVRTECLGMDNLPRGRG